MKTVILSDTHFGVKSNSITWLKSQLQGIEEIVSYIRQQDDQVDVVHCGDLFDSRSSINPYIVYRTNEAIHRLKWYAHHVTILGGNHDYYSPEERDFNVTSLDFINEEEDLDIVAQNPYIYNKALFLPWFVFHNPEKLKASLRLGSYNIIYTHTDLSHLPENIRDIVNRIPVPILSGHIHTPNLTNNQRLTLGSCFPLTFADSNCERGFYTLIDNDVNTLEFHPLSSPIRFYRLYNDDLIVKWSTLRDNLRQNDRMEVYIDSDLFDDKIYKDKIKDYQQLCNVNTIINSDLTLNESEEIKDFDIEKIIEQSIPEHLQKRFEILKEFMYNNDKRK